MIEELFTAALEASDPGLAVARAWGSVGNAITADSPVLLVGAGKSALEMVKACVELLPAPAKATVVAAVPERIGRVTLAEERCGALTVLAADHPLPTQRSVEAGRRLGEAVESFAREYGERGVIVAALSGGGSAHLCVPAAGLELEALRRVNERLQKAGGTIDELNAVRKHTERLKGGGLARLAFPCACEVLVASDVMGDRLDVIASGPMAGDPTTYALALAVLEKYGLAEEAKDVAEHLRRGARGEYPETVKPGDAVLARVHHTVVCGNAGAREAVRGRAVGMGINVACCEALGAGVHAGEAGRRLVRRAVEEILDAARCGELAGKSPRVWIVGGEPVVDTRDGGKAEGTSSRGSGGPSQELALAAALELHARGEALARAGMRMSCGTFSTDGVDGPTDAAGAVVGGQTVVRGGGEAAAREAIRRHDSHGFLERAGSLIRTGPTGVNVNHLACVVAWPVVITRRGGGC